MNFPSTWVQINKTAFDTNIAQFKKLLGQKHIALIIKANGYGHGIETIATLAEQNKNVSWLGVASLSEALQLRTIGIAKPLLVTSCLDQPLAIAAQKNIDVSIFDEQTLKQANEIGTAHNTQIAVHLKFDTGLSRLGFKCEQAQEIIAYAHKLPGIYVRGAYSHFAESQKTNQTFSLEQIKLFSSITHIARAYNVPLIHLANTAGTLAFDLPECNLFRIGVGAYGLWPNPDFQQLIAQRHPNFTLNPILSWKTRINSVTTVPAGQGVGYDRTFTTTRTTRIATIPVGYYDGYDFRLFNRAVVRIGQWYAPIIGRVSMNLSTIDVTHIPTVTQNDEVLLMGDFPNITAYDLGITVGNPNVREITTKINPSIERVIVQGDHDVHFRGKHRGGQNNLFENDSCPDSSGETNL